MSEQTELTYILGAGASYQSIPVVATFSNRFKVFVSFLNDCKSQQSSRYSNIYSLAKRLSEEFDVHQSFDTYFKKLYHTSKSEEINTSKKILNLYFLWEHLDNGKILYNTNIQLSNNDFRKNTKVDKRYDALIAGLLKPTEGEKDFFCNTNFITWNYDLNLFLSLKNYFSPEKTIKAFLEEIQIDDHVWKVQNQITVINMNGYFYSKHLDKFKNILDLDFSAIKQNILQDEYGANSPSEIDSQKIKFAWETQKNEIYDIAIKKIEASKNIVVICYTFPLYNRLSDLKYFNKKSLIQKRLFIQDPKSVIISQNVRENFDISTSVREIQSIQDCDSFFIPNSIFDSELDNYGKYRIR